MPPRDAAQPHDQSVVCMQNIYTRIFASQYRNQRKTQHVYFWTKTSVGIHIYIKQWTEMSVLALHGKKTPVKSYT
jgi:hypothetical protein